MGLEYGMDHGGWFGRVAFTDGSARVLNGQFAETKTAKVGYTMAAHQGGVSFYDSYQKEPSFGDPKRETRWGYYGMTHYGPVAVLGEIAAGTDEAEPTVPGHVTGAKTNRLAYFGEADYAPIRSVNFRLRLDRLEFNRSSNQDVRDTNTHNRYALEGEYVPVPFAELRWTLRRITHKSETLYGHDDETQAYVQFHFSY